MSTGLFQRLHKLADLDIRESSGVPSQLSSEQPTVADLVLPGTGYNLCDEFACLLSVLGGAKRE